MELRQLKYFLEVADARSFVGAANNLFVSRQAVSKAVGQLEGELGPHPSVFWKTAYCKELVFPI